MKQETGITLVTLVVTIIILIILAGVSINTLIGDNGIITKTKQARENIIYAGQEEQEQLNQLFWEMDQEGIYSEDEEGNKKDEMIELLQKQIEELKGQITEQEDTIKDLQNQWGELGTQLGQTNADAGHILKDYKAYSKGKLVTGTMANNGAVSTTLNCGQSYTIPTGYHNGSGKVTANSLASQTQATATANNLSSGVTAWVNGQKITGNGTDVNNSYNNGYSSGQAASVNSASGTFISGPRGTVNTAYCGFRPTKFAVLSSNTGRRSIYLYDARVGLYFSYSNAGSSLNVKSYTITDTGFTLDTGDSSGWESQTMYWFACK